MTRRTRARTVRLPSELDTRAAASLHATLTAARGHNVNLDASEVTWIGGLAAQLLVSAARSWRADGKTLAVRGATAEAIGALQLLGIPEDAIGTGAGT